MIHRQPSPPSHHSNRSHNPYREHEAPAAQSKAKRPAGRGSHVQMEAYSRTARVMELRKNLSFDTQCVYYDRVRHA